MSSSTETLNLVDPRNAVPDCGQGRGCQRLRGQCIQRSTLIISDGNVGERLVPMNEYDDILEQIVIIEKTEPYLLVLAYAAGFLAGVVLCLVCMS